MICRKIKLVKSLDWSHGGLDVETLDVLPVLLQQGDQEVHGQVYVLDQFFLSHANVANSNTEAQNLLHLELDGGLQIQSLLLQVVIVGDQSWELTSLVQSWTQQSWDLLDEGVRGKESIIRSSKLLDLLLVLVQLLEVISRHGVHAKGLGLINMLLISQQTNLVLELGHVLQLDGSGETLVLLWIVILEADLEVHGLGELPLLVLAVLEDSVDTLIQSVTGDLTHLCFSCRSESSNISLVVSWVGRKGAGAPLVPW